MGPDHAPEQIVGPGQTSHVEADPLALFVHESFRSLALNAHFPCVAGRAAVRRNAYRFGLYHTMGEPASAQALARDLTRFNSDPALANEPLTVFAASFVAPMPSDEQRFEALLWRTLQHLSDADNTAWAANRRADPSDPRFSFSFGGAGFFVVGLHAASSRFARRFAWPTLVFNPHHQFDRLRVDGRYDRFRDVIRKRDASLQGTSNPMLADFGNESEARQYSGRSVDEQWRCPFHARTSLPTDGGTE